jgi:hypothetical protein
MTTLDRGSLKSESEMNQELCKDDAAGQLGFDCFPRRTKASKQSLGSDGLIEYISQTKMVSCETVYGELKKHFDWLKDSYEDLYVHALVLSALKFKENKNREHKIDALLSEMGVTEADDMSLVQTWIATRFDVVHNGVFKGNPLYGYDSQRRILKRVEK